MNPKHDPLVKATRKAYRESAVGQLETLLKEESRWKSKETLARNKLRAVGKRIADFARQLSKENDYSPDGKRGDVLVRAKFVRDCKGGAK